MMLILAIILSLSAPLERSIGLFKLIALTQSTITLLSMIGIATLLAATGFYPEMLALKRVNEDQGQWQN